jgi:ApaG protein
MQSLSLSSSSKSLTGLRLVGQDARRLKRKSTVVACGSKDAPTPSSTSFLSRTQTYALLKQQMEVAAKSEVS